MESAQFPLRRGHGRSPSYCRYASHHPAHRSRCSRGEFQSYRRQSHRLSHQRRPRQSRSAAAQKARQTGRSHRGSPSASRARIHRGHIHYRLWNHRSSHVQNLTQSGQTDTSSPHRCRIRQWCPSSLRHPGWLADLRRHDCDRCPTTNQILDKDAPGPKSQRPGFARKTAHSGYKRWSGPWSRHSRRWRRQ